MNRVATAIAVVSAVVFAGWASMARAGQPSAGSTAAEARPAQGSETDWLQWPALAAADVTSQPDSPAAGPAREGDAPSDGPPRGDGSPWLVPWRNYRGDLWTRPTLTGDWGGARQDLMDKGIRFDVSLTQILQRNWAGGRNYQCRYQGGLDLTFQLDTGKAGLWPGGLLKVKGEARYGRGNNLNTGALMPVNFDSLYPVPGMDTIELSELSYTQFLAPWLGVTFGKMSPRETNVFSGDETEQFLNAAFNVNAAYLTTVPQSFLGAGVILLLHEDVMLTTLVLDSEGTADRCGFDTAFDRGTTVYQQLQVTVKPFGLPGHQRVGWTWSDKVKTQLGQNPRQLVAELIRYKLGLGPAPQLEEVGSDWALFYDFDQYLYVVPGSKDRGIGLFGRFGVTDGRANPVGSFYSLGVGGKGLIPKRENDSFGVAYYYLKASDKLGPIGRRFLDGREQGMEVYYNIAVTPWLKITPSVQVIDPMLNGVDTTVVAGVRAKIDF